MLPTIKKYPAEGQTVLVASGKSAGVKGTLTKIFTKGEVKVKWRSGCISRPGEADIWVKYDLLTLALQGMGSGSKPFPFSFAF